MTGARLPASRRRWIAKLSGAACVLLGALGHIAWAQPSAAAPTPPAPTLPAPTPPALTPMCVEVEVSGRKASDTAACLSLRLQKVAQAAHLAATARDAAPGPAPQAGALTAAGQRLGYDLNTATRLTPRRTPDRPAFSPFRPPR